MLLSFLARRIINKSVSRSWQFKIKAKSFTASNKLSPYYAKFSWNLTKRSFATTAALREEKFDLDHPLIKEYFSNLENEFNSKSSRELTVVQNLWVQRQAVKEDLRALEELKSDVTAKESKEMEELAAEERQDLECKLEQLDEEILELLLQEDDADCDPNSLVLEVSAGVGGQEAMLFASELMSMYQGYIAYRGWQQDQAELELSELGGLRHGSLTVVGPGVFSEFKHEGGVHRVQRVPKTEKSGRIHTSTVSVAILPQPTEVAIDIQPKDLKIETKRSSGAGGQHVNTTDSCVRILHVPSGMVVECQTERSQIKNKSKALQWLRARLYQQKLQQQTSDRRDNRKQQVGSSLRSEKIRTYNYAQDRVTDHRVGVTIHNLPEFMSGGQNLESLNSTLAMQERYERLREFILTLRPR